MRSGVALALLIASAPAALSQPAPDPARSEPGEPAQHDPCALDLPGDDARLDRLRAGVVRSVCQSARWFDGLFGDPQPDDVAYEEAYGRLGVGFGWDERDGVSLEGRLRAYLPLPALSERFNAVIGRDSEENFLNEEFDEAHFLAASFSDDRAANWYAGLNYNAARSARSRFDISSGAQVAAPLNPYVKARYRYTAYATDDVLLTARATAFWEDGDGLGVTLAGDSDWAMSEVWLLRWSNTLGLAESTAGMRYRTRLGLYQVLSPRSAMRYEASLRGETDGRSPDLYGLRVSHRRSVGREWLFLEVSGSLFWAESEDRASRCAACVGVAAGIEVLFGDRYDRLLERSRDPGEDAPL